MRLAAGAGANHFETPSRLAREAPRRDARDAAAINVFFPDVINYPCDVSAHAR